MKDKRKDYIFADASSDQERLVLQHQVNKPSFVRAMELVLDEYGLARRLETVLEYNELKALPKKQVRILDLGCGEGLYLHTLAEILENRGLLAAAQLNGIDINRAAIITAEEFSRIAKPPRPYLNFYIGDATRPLEECSALVEEQQSPQFDFIFAVFVLEHLQQARQHLERLYHSLAPGGVLYLRDFVPQEGEEGWVAFHPVMTRFIHSYVTYLLDLNEGVQVAIEQAGWLRQLGAEQVQAISDKMIATIETDLGRKQLRNDLLIIRNSGSMLVARGKLSQGELNTLLETLFRELGPHSRGQSTHMDTFARKPLLLSADIKN